MAKYVVKVGYKTISAHKKKSEAKKSAKLARKITNRPVRTYKVR